MLENGLKFSHGSYVVDQRSGDVESLGDLMTSQSSGSHESLINSKQCWLMYEQEINQDRSRPNYLEDHGKVTQKSNDQNTKFQSQKRKN